MSGEPLFAPPRRPPQDIRLLFATRILRLFSFGFISVILVLYLAAVGLETGRIGLLLTFTLAGIFLANAALLSLPFFISGSLKIAYDLALFRLFRAVDPYKERT